MNALNELIIAEDMRHKLKDGWPLGNVQAKEKGISLCAGIRLPFLLDFEQLGPGEVRFEEGLLLLGADLCFDENCRRHELAHGQSQPSVDMDANYYDTV